jgi:hypothetical protein
MHDVVAQEKPRMTDEPSPTPASSTGADRTKVLSVRLTVQEFAALSALATEVGVGPSTLARTFVRQGLATHSTGSATPALDRARGSAPDSDRENQRENHRESHLESHLETLLAADLLARVEALERWVSAR